MRLERLALLSASMLFAAFAGRAAAADLSIELRDAAGKPVEDAVAWLEPTTSDASVKPSTGAIKQIDREFSPAVSVYPVGTPINFPNEDTVLHHVYSFSPAKSFEIKLYKGAPAAPIVFDKPGVVSIGCNIHDWMEAFVVVVPSRWYGKSQAAGSIRIAGLPADAFKLHLWHSRLAAPEPVQTIEVGAAEQKRVRVVLTLNAMEHKHRPADTKY